MKKHTYFPNQCWCKPDSLKIDGVMRRIHMVKPGQTIIETLPDEAKGMPNE